MTLADCATALQDARDWALWLCIFSGIICAAFGALMTRLWFEALYGPEIDTAKEWRASKKRTERGRTIT